MSKDSKEDLFLRNMAKKESINVPKEIDDIIENTLADLPDKKDEKKINNHGKRKRLIRGLTAAVLTIVVIGWGEKTFNVSAQVSRFLEGINHKKIISPIGEKYAQSVGEVIEKDGYKVTLQKVLSDKESLKAVYEIEGESPETVSLQDSDIFINGNKAVKTSLSGSYFSVGKNKGLFVINAILAEELPEKYEFQSSLCKDEKKWTFKVDVNSSRLIKDTKIVLKDHEETGNQLSVNYKKVMVSPIETKAWIDVKFKDEIIKNKILKDDVSIGFIVKDQEGRTVDNHITGSWDTSKNEISYLLTTMDYDDMPKTLEIIPYIIDIKTEDELQLASMKEIIGKELLGEENSFIIEEISEDVDKFTVKIKAKGMFTEQIASTLRFISEDDDKGFLTWNSILKLREPSKNQYELVYTKNEKNKDYKIQIPKDINNMYKVLKDNKTFIEINK